MNIRNVAIIAHVDHGKTTLVDGMLKQTHTFRYNEVQMQQATILDSYDLEREKGITILAKNTAVIYKNTKINIIDTPGHADFGGEVERIIHMADGALLVVDASEGPLPQTQFVLEQALRAHLRVIVVINKIDRSDARPREVLKETENLFLRLVDSADHLDFPVLYAVGRQGKAWNSLPDDISQKGSLDALFEAILANIPNPPADAADKPFKMLVSSLDFDPHKGTYAIGKISQGSIKAKQMVVLLDENEKAGEYRIDQVFTSKGLKRIEVERGTTGDIVAVTGKSDVSIGQTIADPADPTGFPKITLEEPTLKIILSANTSPLAGLEGTYGTARQLHQRLIQEKKTNIGLTIEQNSGGSSFAVSGRGELHLAILLETLRREGYEMQVGKPEVIVKKINNETCEPYEEVIIEIGREFVGIISEELGKRRAQLLDTYTNATGVTKMLYKISSKNLLGFRGDILTKTRGNGVFATRFTGYFPSVPKIPKLRNGVLIASETGKSSGYALTTVQERGRALIGPGVPVYEGMIIGINNRHEDIDINVCKTKKLTNIHSANADIAIQLDSPMALSLEQCLDFIEDDELLEITPKNLRLRKQYLSNVDRVRAKRQNG
ncbi:translational GTPase TypA [Patescibacteria group bacterium]|nr:translational GTPase TypA [Patescibacteria group bacterium]MBU1473042.1 translational GTPase TypA [Patescibacteria group bacterium]MBU2460202.1 translational GTPase TypA [Patescibacteria group bacterium]MBU2543911.1 translational GTPase TypA [Patescibacteria group bacterium]